MASKVRNIKILILALVLFLPFQLMSEEETARVGAVEMNSGEELIARQGCGCGCGDREKPTLYDWNRDEINDFRRNPRVYAYRYLPRRCLPPKVCQPTRQGCYSRCKQARQARNQICQPVDVQKVGEDFTYAPPME